MNVRNVRLATWIALSTLALGARRFPKVATGVTALLAGTIGIGHGANDDRILAAMWPTLPGGRRSIAAAYAAIALGVFAAARRSPRTAARALDLAGWFHFGTGDAAFARACGSGSGGPFDAAIRGGISRIAPESRVPLIFAAAIAYATSLAARGRPIDAVDVALPALCLRFAPAPLGAAAYFAAWHAPRHVALLLRRDERGGSVGKRLRRFTAETVRNVMLSMIAGMGGWTFYRNDDGARLATAAILALTVPHEITVSLAARFDLSAEGAESS